MGKTIKYSDFQDMKIMNHGLQTISANFHKKLHPNVTVSTTEGGVHFF